MRAYAPDHRPIAKGGAFLVPASPCAVQRPTRNAAGMTATYERHKRRARWSPAHTDRLHVDVSADALALMVRGTLDTLRGSRYRTRRKVCTCCGHASAKLELHPDQPKPKRATIRRRFPRRPLP